MQDVYSALQQGWLILDFDRILAKGAVTEGKGYNVRLSSADGHLQRTVFLPDNDECRMLLSAENILMAA